jgi:hypothetical protein
LFEQASSRGHAQESANGILTFRLLLEPFTTSLSSLQAAYEMRKEPLNIKETFM